MPSGKYDRRVIIQNYTETEDDYGEPVLTWSDQTTLSAHVNYGSGSERRVGAAQEQANLPVTVTVRHSSITSVFTPENSRLSFGGQFGTLKALPPASNVIGK